MKRLAPIALLLSACTPRAEHPPSAPDLATPEAAEAAPGEAFDSCAALKRINLMDLAPLEGLSEAKQAALKAFRAGEDGILGNSDDRFARELSDVAAAKLDASDWKVLAQGESCGSVEVQLLAFADFHGAIEPPKGHAGQVRDGETTIEAGGAEYLATHLKRLQAEHGNSLIVGAGDMIGGSPLISAAFQDEPTIEALNLMNMAITSVGNHEFDEGLDELRRLKEGGCHPEKGCFKDTPYGGASFEYLAANVFEEATGKTAFDGVSIRRFGKVPVAFIGMTLEGTPGVAAPSKVKGLRFQDEADTVNALVPKLKAQGVETIVVLLHEGGFAKGHYNGCDEVSGAIVDVVQRFDPAVDVVVSGHTNGKFICDIDGILVTASSYNGMMVSDIRLELDEVTHEVKAKRATNLVMDRTVERDPTMVAHVDSYRELIKGVENREFGFITEDITRRRNLVGEFPLGFLVADAHLASEADPSTGGAEIAWINSGGVRADLVKRPAEGESPEGLIRFADVFAVQPFGNQMVTMSLTGAQIESVLEGQFAVNGVEREYPKILQISHTLRYSYDPKGPLGDRIDPKDVFVNGQPLDLERTYRVAMNAFLAEGGDGFEAIREGTNRTIGIEDSEAFANYIKANSPVKAPELGRITFKSR